MSLVAERTPNCDCGVHCPQEMSTSGRVIRPREGRIDLVGDTVGDAATDCPGRMAVFDMPSSGAWNPVRSRDRTVSTLTEDSGGSHSPRDPSDERSARHSDACHTRNARAGSPTASRDRHAGGLTNPLGGGPCRREPGSGRVYSRLEWTAPRRRSPRLDNLRPHGKLESGRSDPRC